MGGGAWLQAAALDRTSRTITSGTARGAGRTPCRTACASAGFITGRASTEPWRHAVERLPSGSSGDSERRAWEAGSVTRDERADTRRDHAWTAALAGMLARM